MAARALLCLWGRHVPPMLVIGADRTVLCRACVLRAYTSDFRSEYSLDKLYPPQQKGCDNNADLTKKSVPDIPVDRLSVSYCRSSGPGGQNVNKVNTKAEVRFHLASADWIAEDVRQKMAVMHKNKISRSGELIITSEVSRYQMRNLADCLQKLRDLIAEATEKPQVLSTEDVQVIRERVEKINRERLRQKKIHSALKQSRHVDFE
ncbi:peptidyl-tRNA hydrolase ICT1, mitochondrial [Sphaerodactylus townsendi]|uniref:peptidyl-tRNA hydrolase ICT1, mitochondrial n=1 Tax=Sphaerodactylus townsendi TaxID=933632 RepID=UPI00202754F5|nr:peptidyl-tRNA hydrolase ICT1, mitochondrial [Sphaerodactylus townsendi]